MKSVRALAKSCFLLVLIGHFAVANGQEQRDNFVKRTIRQLFSPEGGGGSAGFMILPAFGYAQETGIEAGAVGIYDFYVDSGNPESRTSNIKTEVILTEKKQKKTKFLTDIWTKGNAYHIVSEFRYRDWPFNFYGMGNDTWQADEERLEQKMARARVEVEKQLAPRFYAGLNADFEYSEPADGISRWAFPRCTTPAMPLPTPPKAFTPGSNTPMRPVFGAAAISRATNGKPTSEPSVRPPEG